MKCSWFGSSVIRAPPKAKGLITEASSSHDWPFSVAVCSTANVAQLVEQAYGDGWVVGSTPIVRPRYKHAPVASSCCRGGITRWVYAADEFNRIIDSIRRKVKPATNGSSHEGTGRFGVRVIPRDVKAGGVREAVGFAVCSATRFGHCFAPRVLVYDRRADLLRGGAGHFRLRENTLRYLRSPRPRLAFDVNPSAIFLTRETRVPL